MNEIRYAVRSLVKTPAFTLVVLLTLALGIGANTAIFSVVDAVLLRALPYPEPDRMVSFFWQTASGLQPMAVSPPMFQFWKDNAKQFDGLVATRGGTFNMMAGSSAERVRGLLGTADLFTVLKISPMLGRSFLPEECLPGGPSVTVLTYGLWQRAFGGAADVVGKEVLLNDRPYTIIGVMPQAFSFEPSVDVVNPFQMAVDPRDHGMNYTMIGRIRSDSTRQQAQAETASLYRTYYGQNASHLPRDWGLAIGRFQDYLVADMSPLLLLLLGAVGLVLLIACGNVANLLLSRSAAKQREIAIRSALGASTSRLARQMLTESVLLALGGGTIGIVFASWGLHVLVAMIPGELPRLSSIALDYRVLGFALAVSLAVGIAFGSIGALRLLRTDANAVLKATSGTGLDRFRSRLGNALIVGEVALSFILLMGAGLLIATFMNLRGIQVGFDTANLAVLQAPLSSSKFAPTAAVTLLDQQILERVRALPGVDSAATAGSVPLQRGFNFIFTFEGEPADKIHLIEYRAVSADYFRTLGIPIQAGRAVDLSDGPQAAAVVVVNERLAKLVGASNEALGRRIVIGRTTPMEDVPREIVGVVSDVSDGQPGTRIFPTVYVPRAQLTDAFNADMNRSLSLLVRTKGRVELAAELRKIVQAVDPQVPISSIRSLNEIGSTAIAQQRFNMMLMGVFAASALLLTSVGLYGVLSYQVEQRSREIGVRMALGARRAHVLRMVLARGLVLSATGLAIGITASFGLQQFVKTLLFRVSPTSPWLFGLVALVLLAVASLASFIPARRAMRVDPVVALRGE